MKLKEFLKKVDQLDPEMELYCNNNVIYDVEIQEDSKIVLKFENPLEAYYNYRSNMNALKDMVKTIKNDGVEAVSEVEAVAIAKHLNLRFRDVVKGFNDENIKVEVL